MFNKSYALSVIVIVLLISTGHSAQAAWGLTTSQFNRMIKESSLSENLKLSKKEKIKRIKNHIQRTSHNGLDVIDLDELAEQIVDVAACTGVDFSFFSAVLKVESDHCRDRYNNSSKASGCGQFTTSPIKVFKNQLRLPGRKENGHPKFKKALEVLINKCFAGDSDRIEEFKEVYSQKPRTVQQYLRSGEDIELDLISSALYLKFKYARTGFYYNPNTKSPGALSLYGTESGYGTKVYNEYQKVQFQDFNLDGYLDEIATQACQISEDSQACKGDRPTYEI